MEQSWQDWIQTSIDMGCDREALRAILEQNNFSAEDIRIHLDARAASPKSDIVGAVDHAALTRINITRIATKLETDLAQVYTLDDFLTAEECDTLVAHSITGAMMPSVVGTGYVDASHRSSSSYHLYDSVHPLVHAIDKRIEKAMGINLAYSEIMQIQHYAVGQEFKPHHDYFTPDTAAFTKYATHIGNRTWTLMMYLTDTTKGGGTQFPKLGTTFYPKKGQALIWNNLYADGRPNPDTLHAGMPVEEGIKVIITKWFRERSPWPMIL